MDYILRPDVYTEMYADVCCYVVCLLVGGLQIIVDHDICLFFFISL